MGVRVSADDGMQRGRSAVRSPQPVERTAAAASHAHLPVQLRERLGRRVELTTASQPRHIVRHARLGEGEGEAQS